MGISAVIHPASFRRKKMVRIRIDDVLVSKIVDGADANGKLLFARSLAVVFTILSDPPVESVSGYHVNQFQGMTRDQIRAFILADIRASLAPQTPVNDASALASITPGEILDL
jgi:hypothetical protein